MSISNERKWTISNLIVEFLFIHFKNSGIHPIFTHFDWSYKISLCSNNITTLIFLNLIELSKFIFSAMLYTVIASIITAREFLNILSIYFGLIIVFWKKSKLFFPAYDWFLSSIQITKTCTIAVQYLEDFQDACYYMKHNFQTPDFVQSRSFPQICIHMFCDDISMKRLERLLACYLWQPTTGTMHSHVMSLIHIFT